MTLVTAKEVFKSFFAVTGTEGKFTYNVGHERIPENWYRIPVDYNLADLNLDIVGWVLQHPELGSVGGNTGTVNSFVGLDVTNITSGVLNAGTLLEGNNLMCFALDALKTFAPNSLSPLFETLAVPLALLDNAVTTAVSSLACPAFADLAMDGEPLDEALLGKYPGAAKSSSAL